MSRRLDDRDRSFREQPVEIVPRVEPLTGRDGNARLLVRGPLDRPSGHHLQEDITGQVISTAKSIQVELTK